MTKQNVFLFNLFKVHIRIASPPLLHPCYMGINIPTRDELIGNKLKPDELAKYVGRLKMNLSK